MKLLFPIVVVLGALAGCVEIDDPATDEVEAEATQPAPACSSYLYRVTNCLVWHTYDWRGAPRCRLELWSQYRYANGYAGYPLGSDVTNADCEGRWGSSHGSSCSWPRCTP